MILTFPIKPPFDPVKTFQAVRYSSVLGTMHDGKYRRLVQAGKGIGLVEFESVGDTDAPQILARVIATRGAVDESALTANIRHIVNPELDRTPFYAYASQIPSLWATVNGLHGLHTLRIESLYDALVMTVIEQQISLRAAQLAERWLMMWGGDSMTYDGETFYTFPSMERIAAATVEELTPLKITFIRMRVLIALAGAGMSGEIDYAALRESAAEQVYARLTNLKGVGHWTAAWAMIRAMGHYVYIGSADVALRAAVNNYFYGKTGRADRDVTDQTFAAFGEHGGAASYYVIMRYAFEKY